MKRLSKVYNKITDFNHLKDSANKARRGKKKRPAVLKFFYYLEPELLTLQQELRVKTYSPGSYIQFTIHDPKKRTICAAPFRDRVVHHAICSVLEPWFERFFISHSYACRKGKGQHLALQKAQDFSQSHRYYLKCDIRKFFESIDHQVLKGLLQQKIKDPNLLWLCSQIIESKKEKGVPIGNLTSQHFANLYLDALDHFVKEELQVKRYIRYMDDFVLWSNEKSSLQTYHQKIKEFLQEKLQLQLKEKGTFLQPVSQGLPFLGFRVFPNLKQIKRSNWKRFTKKFRQRQKQYEKGEISQEEMQQSIASLLGHIKQGDTWHLRNQFLEKYSEEF